MNELGKALYNKWDRIYRGELQRIRAERNDPEYIEGWCIIDNYDFVKTLEDEVGLLIFGYDDGLPQMFENQWPKIYREDEYFFTDINGKDYTLKEVKEKCKLYFDGWED